MQNAPPIRAEADLNQLVGEAGELVGPAAASRGVRLELNLAEDLPHLTIDSIQLQQVVINLVSNAVEAATEGGRTGAVVFVRTWQDADGSVGVSVSDDGPGIAPDHLDQLFLSFFTTKKAGLGLGLAICRDIVVSHEGRIWAENKPEGGSAFHFVLPITPKQADCGTADVDTLVGGSVR